MARYLCIRKNWTDAKMKGNHELYEEGKIYVFPKGAEVPRHFIEIKENADGEVEVVGKVVTRKGASERQIKQEKHKAQEVVKTALKQELSDNDFKVGG